MAKRSSGRDSVGSLGEAKTAGSHCAVFVEVNPADELFTPIKSSLWIKVLSLAERSILALFDTSCISCRLSLIHLDYENRPMFSGGSNASVASRF